MGKCVEKEPLLEPFAQEKFFRHEEAPTHDDEPGLGNETESTVEIDGDAQLEADGDGPDDFQVPKSNDAALENAVGVL